METGATADTWIAEHMPADLAKALTLQGAKLGYNRTFQMVECVAKPTTFFYRHVHVTFEMGQRAAQDKWVALLFAPCGKPRVIADRSLAKVRDGIDSAIDASRCTATREGARHG